MDKLESDCRLKKDSCQPQKIAGNSPQLLSPALSQKYSHSTDRDSTLHQIAPYIGKMKPGMASALISTFTHPGEVVYDPFSGSGTVALEAWAAGCHVLANDLSPYASTLTRAKLFPPISSETALKDFDRISKKVLKHIHCVDLRHVPKWVRSFFHPETLREAIAWSEILQATRSTFLMSCLLGILHHQRPGFLSYPSSHTVPYLRDRSFPKDSYPDLYDYRNVEERLSRKIARVTKRIPDLDRDLKRKCHTCDAVRLRPRGLVDAIITSPPYMSQLDYGRDNRLRLWFLGVSDWRSLDASVSPAESAFLPLLRSCLKNWHNILRPGGVCVIVLGDSHCRSYDLPLHAAVSSIATTELKSYELIWMQEEPIPDRRRVRRSYRGSLTETIIALRNL
jgi:hypothetical protein